MRALAGVVAVLVLAAALALWNPAGHFDTLRLSNDMGIGQDLAIGGEDEARAKTTTKVRASAIRSTKAPAFALYINTDDCGSNSLRRCRYSMRIGVQGLRVFFVCAHTVCRTFPWNPLNVL
jgi:hypothetical protein